MTIFFPMVEFIDNSQTQCRCVVGEAKVIQMLPSGAYEVEHPPGRFVIPGSAAFFSADECKAYIHRTNQ